VIVEKFLELTSEMFEDPGWMREFFDDIVRKRQYIVTVDDKGEISSLLCYWKFGNKRWGFIRKCQFSATCPKQMGKGNHLYIPIFWIREDKRGEITVKKFTDILKRECADATTLSWHNNDGKFITFKLIRRSDNECIQESNQGCRQPAGV